MDRVSSAVLILATATAAPLAGQSLLYRPPNLGGTWVPDAAVVQFDFVHRFYVSPAPSHAVVNFPTFTLAVGLGRGAALGWHFGTHSTLTPPGAATTNESEWYARWRLRGAEGHEGFTLSITPAYNQLAKSADGELSVDYTYRRLTLTGAVRGMTKPLGVARARAAFAGGFALRLSDYIGVSADAGSFVSPTVRAAWSAAIDFVIPGSPHTFSLQTSNATTSTIEGNSIGFPKRLYGFEFTIPLHLSRFSPWFHPRRAAPQASGATGAAAAEVRMHELAFRGDSVTVAAGQIVRWINDDPVEHSVTFEGAGAPASSALIAARGSYGAKFDKPGVYAYHCSPHPFMKGVVVVR